MSKSYNILHLVLDQLAPHFLPNYGHPIVRAPDIYSLSNGAATFDNAYTNSPLCVPARASLFTGHLPSKVNVFDTGSELPAGIPTLGHYLRQAGYATCLSGKCHFIGPDQMHGFEQRLTSDMCPSDFSMTGNWDLGETPLDFFHTLENVQTAGVAERSTQQDHDEETTHQARQWLYDWVRQDKDRPFYLYVSLSHPHDPYVTPKRYWDQYVNSEIDLPTTPFIPVDERDAYSAWTYRHYDRGEYDIHEADIRNARHAYYGNVSYVDDLLGQVLDTLNRIGVRDNTIIVLCADHGDMLGERGQWYKMTPFENSTRIPLIINLPGQKKSSRIKENVSLVDLLPTLLDLGTHGEALSSQLSIESINGKSLRPLLENDTTDWHDVAISEMMFEGLTDPAVMIRKGKYKYVHINESTRLLFNIEEDPLELNDLSTDQRWLTEMGEFQNIIADGWDLEDISRFIKLDQRRRNFIFKAHQVGRRPSWDFQPLSNASELYHRSHITWLEADKRDLFKPKNLKSNA